MEVNSREDIMNMAGDLDEEMNEILADEVESGLFTVGLSPLLTLVCC